MSSKSIRKNNKETISTLNKTLLRKLKDGVTVLVSTHVFTYLEQNADTLTVLFNEKIIYHEDSSKMTSESIYICRRDTFTPSELVSIIEKAREIHVIIF